MKTKQAKKNITRIYLKKNKTDLAKTWEAIRPIVKVGIKSKRTLCFLNLNVFLLLNQ